MGKVEDALRDLIYYHGRRAAREVLENLPDRVRDMGKRLRDLERSVEELRGDVNELMAARRERMDVPPAEEEEVEKSRVTTRTLKSIRRRFDLTQEDLARLLDVSPVTVTAWETGKSRPRKNNQARIITLREMDLEEVDEALGREHVPASLDPEWIKRLRGKLGLTQAELAQLVGVSGGSVTSWETGKTEPGRENRKALVELSELTRGEVAERLGRPVKNRKPQGSSEESGEEISPEAIRGIRDGLELSQGEFAGRLGVSANTISNWETGRSEPRAANLEKLRELQ